MTLKNNNIYTTCTLLLVLVLMLLIREFWFASRQGLHVDESLSFILSAYKDYGWTKVFSTFTELTGNQVRQFIWFSDDSIKGMFRDVYHLWLDNRDTPHSNLYYSFLRVWFTGINPEGNTAFITNWAFKLNQVFFAISFITIYTLARKLFNNNLIALLVVFVSFINTASISNTIFIRPYQMQEAFVSIYTLTSLLLIKNALSWRLLLAHSIATSFTMLSGYFALFYVALISLFLFPFLILKYRKSIRNALEFAAKYIAITAILSYAIYPKYFFVDGNRQGEALDNLGAFSENLLISINSLTMINSFFPVGIVVALIVAILSIFLISRHFKSDIETNYFVLTVSVSVLLWIVIVQFLSPYKGLARYIYSSLPLFGVFYGYLVYLSHKYLSEKIIYTGVVSAFILSASIFSYFNGEKVDYINKNRQRECAQIPEHSVIIAKSPWKMGYIATCLHSDSKYGLTNNFDYNLFKSKGYSTIISDHDISSDRAKLTNDNVMAYFKKYSLN
ncbi:hypothetical protein O3Q73_000756 [Escherichia coli]|uniref:hypothetical protein n=1 Tax=Escherichia coli TaxID=562 RepID=UPI001B116244|nr:hypothetical protein [Escherichia coli]EKG5117697.1 hypothetical protein [Escherichia coli]MCX3186794.1 hypothetical protein [Escherichia coli]HBB0334943.1 hypothetical protein [Escherichia coli]